MQEYTGCARVYRVYKVYRTYYSIQDVQGYTRHTKGYNIQGNTRLRVVSNFGDGDCGADEIHTRARNFEETRRGTLL